MDRTGSSKLPNDNIFRLSLTTVSATRTTPVPRLDAASSRLLLLALIPQLSTITPPHLSSPPTPRSTPYRALDCGAGIGRITSSVLLPLFPIVDLVEPVPSFLAAANKHAAEAREGWKLTKVAPPGGVVRQVRLWQAGLQYFDPSPARMATGVEGGKVELVAKVGEGEWPDEAEEWEGQKGLDVCWVQWCVGHLSHDQLVAFLKRAKAALRRGQAGEVEGFVVVKENVCKDDDGDGAGALFDEDDSSTTR